VLLLVIDTQRADHLSCYGNPRPTSPVLDALAREGVRFENAVAQCSWTSPSMVSMLTSCYIAEEGLQIPADKTTLAEVFKAAGWATGAFICNDLLSPDNHFQRGFDVFEWKLTPYGSNDPIVEWIEKTKGERSFTFVHFNEVHDPYHPTPEFVRFKNEKGSLTPERLRFYDKVSAELGLVQREKSQTEIAEEIGSYDDDVRYCDERIRGVFDAIKAAGIWDSTAILVGADHGEGLWTRVQFLDGSRLTAQKNGEPPTLLNTLQMTHGSQVNWELVHVPMIVRYPGLEAGGTVAGYVENIDILPTLVDLAGLTPPPTAQGQSLVPLARDPSSKKGLKESLFTHTRFNSSIVTQEGMQLIHPTPEGECAFDLTDELYDLHADREERKNLAGEKRELVKKLAALVAPHMRMGITGNSQVTPTTQKSLQGLGYTDSGVVSTVREELAKESTPNLLVQYLEERICIMRLEIVRALKGRDLTQAERSRLSNMRARERSPAVRDMIDAVLAPH
jgi:arylsulfatase A-like enzyme